MTSEFCPICESAMEFVREERPVSIGKRSATVPDEFLRCTQCGEELYLPGQMEATQVRASRSIRQAEGLLQPEEIKGIRDDLGLSQSAFEQLIGVGPKTVVRWERGTVFQNSSTDVLLRVLRRFPEVARFLAARHAVELPRSARGLTELFSVPKEFVTDYMPAGQAQRTSVEERFPAAWKAISEGRVDPEDLRTRWRVAEVAEEAR